MLLKRKVLDAIAQGSVSLVFRRWRRPTVRAGGRLNTAVGVLAIGEMTAIEAAAIDEASARRAGYGSAAALRAELAEGEGRLYRIAVSLAGADPRVALCADDRLGAQDRATLSARLDRLDRAAPWTRRTLDLIAGHPGLRAAELARMLGRETQALKADIRKLKALGLTESLDIGYRLSPRGAAFRSGDVLREASDPEGRESCRATSLPGSPSRA